MFVAWKLMRHKEEQYPLTAKCSLTSSELSVCFRMFVFTCSVSVAAFEEPCSLDTAVHTLSARSAGESHIQPFPSRLVTFKPTVVVFCPSDATAWLCFDTASMVAGCGMSTRALTRDGLHSISLSMLWLHEIRWCMPPCVYYTWHLMRKIRSLQLLTFSFFDVTFAIE